MTSNSIYIGLVLVAPILNQKRYQAVFNEVLQYLQTNSQDLHIQVFQNRFITFQSIQGSTTDAVTLPLSSLYLHTCYYRLHTGYQLQAEDKKFATIAWEVFNILKENFPSKIFLTQENLEQCKPTFIQITPNEELRRQISCLLSLKDEDRMLTYDEMEDCWYTLQFAEKLNDQRALNTCLELISTQIAHNVSQFKNIIELETLQRIISKNDYTQLSSNKMLANEILERISLVENQNDITATSFQRQTFDALTDDTTSIKSSSDFNDYNGKTINHYEKPTSTRMCLFQLSESNDINRVTVILETIVSKSKDSLTHLRKKYNLNHKIISILKKYCNAEYGFDHTSSKYGQFQYNLLKLMIILAQDYVVFLEYLQTQTLDFLSQLMEEAIIFVYEEALQGSKTISQMGATNQAMNNKLFKFLILSLEFMELSISKQFQEYMPQLRENLRKIQQRFSKIIQKKENPILKIFLMKNQLNQDTEQSQYENRISREPSKQDLMYNKDMNIIENEYQQQDFPQFSGLNGDLLNELRVVSEDLYRFAIELCYKLQRVEALNDIYEEHEEKHQRLFFKICPNVQQPLKEQQTHNTKQFQQPSIMEKPEIDYYKGISRDTTSQKKYISENTNNYQPSLQNYKSYNQDHDNNTRVVTKETYSSNVFLKNQIEQGYKRVTSQKSQKGIISNNKENEPHYIGSPIKPLQKQNENENRYRHQNSYK